MCMGDARGIKGKQKGKDDWRNTDGNKKEVMKKRREDRRQQGRNNSGSTC